jgi:hypothetical protein
MNFDKFRNDASDPLADENAVAGIERRQHPRRDTDVCITATPVDESGKETGPVHIGYCLDVSDSGLKITLARPTTSRFLRIEPTAASSKLGFASAVMEVLRQATECNCFTYAGRFVQLPADAEPQR